MKQLPALLLATWAVLGFAAAVAQTTAWPLETSPQTIALERERIDRERRSEEARFSAEQAICYRRFAVNDCLRDIRGQHRQVMEKLRLAEIQLNDLERRQRAAEQERAAAERSDPAALQEAIRQREAVRAEHEERLQRAADKQADRERAQADRLPRQAPAPYSASGPDAAQQAENRRLFEEKQRQALERKAEREKNLADKAAKPAVQPLPSKAP